MLDACVHYSQLANQLRDKTIDHHARRKYRERTEPVLTSFLQPNLEQSRSQVGRKLCREQTKIETMCPSSTLRQHTRCEWQPSKDSWLKSTPMTRLRRIPLHFWDLFVTRLIPVATKQQTVPSARHLVITDVTLLRQGLQQSFTPEASLYVCHW